MLILRQIRTLLDVQGCSEPEALDQVGKAAELLRQYHTETLGQDNKVLYAAFDRSEEYDMTAVDECFSGIESLVAVKMSIYQRRETTLFGEKKVRLLAIQGIKPDIQFAHWLYNMLDDLIIQETEMYRAECYKHRFDKVRINGEGPWNEARAIAAFQAGVATRINESLKKLGEAQVEPVVQWSERAAHNGDVAGSIPAGLTNPKEERISA